MAAARRQGSIPRSAALIALAAVAVHQLRYLLSYGSGSGEELARQGHAYLFQALPILIGFGVATVAATLVRAALSPAPGRPAIASPHLRVLVYAAAIATAFAVQETAEGLLFAGHASGIAAVLGAGGWLALPLATFFGALCAALDGGLAKLESLLATAALPSGRPRAPRGHGAFVSRTSVPLASRPLAFGLARRPPPPPS
jgi:hypothetical protein